MNPYVAEFLGTALLILLGNGVVANVVLSKTKGEGAGWIAITWGWGMAVFVAVFCTANYSGAHLNPAVTFGTAAVGKFDWALVPGYVGAQVAGAMLGACLVYFGHKQHYDITACADTKLATFSTAPAIRSPVWNILSEAIGTFVLVFAVLLMDGATWSADAGGTATSGKIGLGSIGALPVGLLVLAIGLSLGGTTGYAINPARDLGPRIAHALLPVPGKRDSDWGYAWIPVVGPLAGGLFAAGVYALVTTG